MSTLPNSKPFHLLRLRRIVGLSLLITSVVACGGPEEPQVETAEAVITGARGRPRIANNTVVTDEGELLRGAFWPLDTQRGTLPTRAQVRALKSQGLNTLHLYAETWAFGEPAGIHLAQVNTLVNWTRQDGLYLVLTIGNGKPHLNGTFNQGFARRFWNVYGRRYRNEPHVIYELHNEPQNGVPLNSATRSLQRDLFDRLRRKAPSTLLLVFSYPQFINGPGVIQDANWLRTHSTLNWGNAAIAFHGYARPESLTTNTLNYVNARGIPVFQTEFFDADRFRATNGNVWQADASQTGLYERTKTSWLSFLPLNEISVASEFKNVMDSNWISWGADFGTWPATNSPPKNQTISLKVPTNNRFVVAENAGASPLIANRVAAGPWERFRLCRWGRRTSRCAPPSTIDM